jgi:hypothetical protein
MADIIDSYSEINWSTDIGVGDGVTITIAGQSFTCGSNYTLDSAKFELRKTGSPTGSAYAKLFSHSGTYGTSSVGNVLLATSDAFDVSTLTTSHAPYTFTFSGVERIALTPNYYVIVVEFTGGNASDYIRVGYDWSSPSHDGNLCKYVPTTWTAMSNQDACFYVYGVAATGTRHNLTLLGVG